jgi:hypothetical protein
MLQARWPEKTEPATASGMSTEGFWSRPFRCGDGGLKGEKQVQVQITFGRREY